MDQVANSSARVCENTDYGEVLDEIGIESVLDPIYYYNVGKTEVVQGWILYVSVIRSQLEQAIRKLSRILADNQIHFRVIQNYETAKMVLDGILGREHVGKVISIFPETDDQAIQLAIQLIELTKEFRGPAVPSAKLLGGQVYCRYGAHMGVMAELPNGYLARHIYNNDNALVPDDSFIPLRIPSNHPWPFSSILKMEEQNESSFHPKYRVVGMLREHPRGNVLIVNSTDEKLRGQKLVAKEGRKNMWSDDYGRDICDRLRWQAHIHQELDSKVPIPKFIDYIEWNESEYLIMEFIDGISVTDAVEKINSKSVWWPSLAKEKKARIIEIIIQIADAIQLFHKEGYSHRDVTPMNFLLTTSGEVRMIDIELSVSTRNNIPFPAFELGTEGFMSPQQANRKVVGYEDDLYGLGATILSLLTLYSPYRFGVNTGQYFQEQLKFLIGDHDLEGLIFSLLIEDPAQRTNINEALEILKWCHRGIQSNAPSIESEYVIDKKGLRKFIQRSINGLNSVSLPIRDSLWYFPASYDWEASAPRVFTTMALGEGIAGVLSTIEHLAQKGYRTVTCQKKIERGYHYLWEIAINHWQNYSPGYYSGLGGLASTLVGRRESGAIVTHPELLNYLLSVPSKSLDIKNGYAGQGIAILQCYPNRDEFAIRRLNYIIEKILEAQVSPGLWLFRSDGSPDINYYTGNSGILSFLIQVEDEFNRPGLKTALRNGKDWTISTLQIIQTNVSRKNYPWLFSNGSFDQILGGISILIEFNKVQFNPDDERLIKSFIEEIETHFLYINSSLKNGLTALGQLCIECYKLFKDKSYLRRAEWIGNFLMSISVQNENEVIWKTSKSEWADASLMTGACGTILFLDNLFELL